MSPVRWAPGHWHTNGHFIHAGPDKGLEFLPIYFTNASLRAETVLFKLPAHTTQGHAKECGLMPWLTWRRQPHERRHCHCLRGQRDRAIGCWSKSSGCCGCCALLKLKWSWREGISQREGRKEEGEAHHHHHHRRWRLWSVCKQCTPMSACSTRTTSPPRTPRPTASWLSFCCFSSVQFSNLGRLFSCCKWVFVTWPTSISCILRLGLYGIAVWDFESAWCWDSVFLL